MIGFWFCQYSLNGLIFFSVSHGILLLQDTALLVSPCIILPMIHGLASYCILKTSSWWVITEVMLEFGIGGSLKRNQSSVILKWLIWIVLLSFRLWYRIRNFEESKPGMFTSISLYTPGWPDIHYVALAGLKMASTSLVLGFSMWPNILNCPRFRLLNL